MMSKQILAVLMLTSLVKMELPFLKKLQGKLQKPPNCQQYTTQLTSLFTLMCNNIENGENNVFRDACIGCFQQATVANNNQASLVDLNDCAQNYLLDTRYEECTNRIDGTPGNEICVSGYCNFVTCIRRINSDLLIAQCYEQASADNDAVFEEDQVILFKNITSCILAKTRCASINPISGEQQSSSSTTTTYDIWGKPRTNQVSFYNTLQITPDGDVRIVRFPGATRIQSYFCISQPNLKQSSWLEFSC